MARFLATRTIGLLATGLVASFVVYAAVFVAPGSPIGFLTGGRAAPPELIARLEEQYHLNEPLLVGYWEWLQAALGGNLGDSIILAQPVSEIIAARAPTTVLLVAYASLLIIIAGIGLGTLAALRPGRLDDSIMLVTTAGIAVPSFVAAVGLIALFSVELGIFPIYGAGEGLFDQLYHLTLPAIALALSSAAFVASVTRAAVREELVSEHVQTARVRGLSQRQIIGRHVLRNAAIPITTVGGLLIGSVVAGATIVERAFQVDGLGSYLIQAVLQKDFPVVQGITLLLVLTFVVLNLLTDLLYRALDPRVAARERRR